MFTLVDVLRREHDSMRALLNVMEEQVAEEATPDYGLLGEILLYCESYPDAYHHPKEDLIYAALCKHAPEAADAVQDLQAEHVIMASATREVLGLVSRAAAGSISAEENLLQKIGAYVRFYRAHIRREESDFFPRALEALAPEHWLELETHVINPTDPHFSTKSAALMRAFLDRAPK
jgi:hemerythrin-like domain-containing protein